MATFDARYAKGYLDLFRGSVGFLGHQIELAEEEVAALRAETDTLKQRIAELEGVAEPKEASDDHD